MKSLSPGTQAISQGRHAELYALEPGHVLKLFRPGHSRNAVETELQRARSAYDAGIPTPRAERIIESNGRSGIVFERCDGPTLFSVLAEQAAPVQRMAQVFFDLQRAIHASAPQGFAPMKEQLAAKISHAQRAAAPLRQRALEVLARLPSGTAACHGDFHPANVIMTAKGPVVIDWVDAGRADATLDTARSLLLLRHAWPGKIDEGVRAQFVEAYMQCVRGAWSGNMAPIERWMLPLAVARLAEAAEETECDNLLKLVSTILSASPS